MHPIQLPSEMDLLIKMSVCSFEHINWFRCLVLGIRFGEGWISLHWRMSHLYSQNQSKSEGTGEREQRGRYGKGTWHVHCSMTHHVSNVQGNIINSFILESSEGLCIASGWIVSERVTAGAVRKQKKKPQGISRNCRWYGIFLGHGKERISVNSNQI